MKKKVCFLAIAVLIIAAVLVGCNNEKNKKGTEFTEGDYICAASGANVTILGLSKEGKQKEVLIVPEFIREKKVVGLGDEDHSFVSEKLKKLYIPFALENQWEGDDPDAVINIPNAFIVGTDETTVVRYANPGYICKNVVLSPDRAEIYKKNWTDGSKFLAANIVYCEYNMSVTSVLWADYITDTCPGGYLPEFPKKEDQSLVGWYTDKEKTQVWDGTISGETYVYGQYGYADGTVWGIKNEQSGKIQLMDFLSTLETLPTHLVLPGNIGDKEVDSIGSGAFRGREFLSVSIPASVESIGMYAFENCTRMSDIIFQEGSCCKTIYGEAFNGCSALTIFHAPDSLENIWWSFNDCTALSTVELGNATVSSGSFTGCTALTTFLKSENNTSVEIDGGVLYSVNNDAKRLIVFAGGSTQTSYEIASDCISIEEGAFKGNTCLTEVSAAGLISIRYKAFENCTSLRTVNFNAMSLGEDSFKNCCALTSVTLRGNGNVQLGSNAFAGTTEECVFYVPASKVEYYTECAAEIGILGTITALE